MLIITLLYIAATAFFIIFLFIVILIISILQNGGKWNGKSLDENLGMPANKAKFENIKNMSKAQLMQIFYSASAPAKKKLKGEIWGTAPATGIFYPFAIFFLTFFYGQGSKWIGKAFRPDSSKNNPDYNLFRHKNEKKIQRKRLMDVYIKESNIDKNNSLHLDYSAYNNIPTKLIRDEVREINSELYIGMGYLLIPLGWLNPIPFILHGKFRPWVGPDKQV